MKYPIVQRLALVVPPHKAPRLERRYPDFTPGETHQRLGRPPSYSLQNSVQRRVAAVE